MFQNNSRNKGTSPFALPSNANKHLTAKKFLSAVSAQKREVRYTASSPTEQKPDTAESLYTTEKYEFSGNADLKSGNGDVKLNVTFSSDDESGKYLEYFFLRNWNAFSCAAEPDEEGNVTDISGCTVVKYEEWNGYVDGENGCELRFDPGYYDDDNYRYNGNSVCLNVTPQVDAQGNVTGLYVDGDKENPVVNGGTYTLNMEVEVFNYATNERTTEKVDFIIVFLMENYDYEYMIEINTDGNVRMDNGYFVKQYEYLAYNSNVAKILAGTPDWHLAG